MDYGFGDCHYPHPDKVTETMTVSEDAGNPFELDRADCLEVLHPIKLIYQIMILVLSL
jgi:hypothetical protein